MNTINQSSAEELSEPSQFDGVPDYQNDFKVKINGFDGGTKPFFQEPSLYISIAMVFTATYVCLSKTPFLFWSAFAAMTAVVISAHVMVERYLFKRKEEYKMFAAPFEGMFVITLGSILPGLTLLAYAGYAVLTVHNLNILEVLGKIALLLVIPLFNFWCWSAIRKGYLVRPRVIGLMTGFALGLSASWTCIFLKTAFGGQPDAACKFGWMLLLSTSPFLLFAAICLSLDLWNKTDTNIRRITTIFSLLGILLSAFFAFTPLVRTLWVQSLIKDARVASAEDKSKTISALRESTSDRDLRPSKYSLSGFSLADLLISDRGLSSGSEQDKQLYFETTGASILSDPESGASEKEQVSANAEAGTKIDGLSLAKSQLTGTIDATSLSSSIDWTMTFKSVNQWNQEARCEIALPNNAVVSRATLWINGEPKEAAFASTTSVKEAYQTVVSRQRDPLLVTMPTSDHVLVQCFPISATSGEMKVRIGFKVPLEPGDGGKNCSLALPKILNSNFGLPKRQHFNLFSRDPIAKNDSGLAVTRDGYGYSLIGAIRNQQDKNATTSFVVQRETGLSDIVVPVYFSHQQKYIVERIKQVAASSSKRLAVVIDTSATLKPDVANIKKALASIPADIATTVYFVNGQKNEATGLTIAEATKRIDNETFVGGQNNWSTLSEALENTAENPNGAVVWIHGPQPISVSNSTPLDLMNRVRFCDMQIEDGPNVLLPALQTSDLSGIIAVEKINHKSLGDDMKSLLSNLRTATTNLAVEMTSTTTRPKGELITDDAISAQVSCLWAKTEVARLIASGQTTEALALGSKFRIISPISGAVVLENAKTYNENGLKLPEYVANTPSGQRAGGLIGAAVDPAFGQANETGMLADYSYGMARDAGRWTTFASLILSIIIAVIFLRNQKEIKSSMMIKTALMVVAIPMAVHMLSIFLINNFGGLGGGL